MIDLSHILALSQPDFVRSQLTSLFARGGGDERRASFRRGWGFGEP